MHVDAHLERNRSRRECEKDALDRGALALREDFAPRAGDGALEHSDERQHVEDDVAVDLLADFHAARAEVFRAPDERFPNLLLHDDAPLARLFLIQRVVFEWLRSGGAGGRGESAQT